MSVDRVGLRRAAEGCPEVDPPWPRRPIQKWGTCDGCAENRDLVMAYDDPSGLNEPWLCAECAAEADFIAAASPDVVLALLDDLAAAEEALGRVEVLAEAMNAVPDYTATVYDQGRVDQRHMDCEALFGALASGRAASGAPRNYAEQRALLDASLENIPPYPRAASGADSEEGHARGLSAPTAETVDLLLAQVRRDRNVPYWSGPPHEASLDGAEAWLLSLRDWLPGDEEGQRDG